MAVLGVRNIDIDKKYNISEYEMSIGSETSHFKRKKKELYEFTVKL